MIEKRIICPQRLRRVPQQFSWVDHRLVRNKHICGLSYEALALYLFLVTVADAEGLSYYSDGAINRYLRLGSVELSNARAQLCQAGLIAYSSPFYQVLSLGNASPGLPPAPCEDDIPDTAQRGGDVVSVGTLLRQLSGRDTNG